MINFTHMVEFDDGTEGRNDISQLVNEVVISENREGDEPLDEHENLIHEARVLKEKLHIKRRESGDNNEFDKNIYGAAYYLADALDFVLAEGVDVSNIDPETNQNENQGNVARDMFINSISRALNHLGMDGNSVKVNLKDEDDG